ncbi:MAG TPA: hypothetical protein VNZ55_12245, partial [Thermomicrobiales bacterium]|nr:hypothetical protein [Thermomicrobiales bacterium]
MVIRSNGPLHDLYVAFREGGLTRRVFLERSAALGIGASAAHFLANAGSAGAASGFRDGFAVVANQDATATPDAAGRPAFGTDGPTRG